MNVWKVSTVASVLALTLVVGQGAIQPAAADAQPAMVKALTSLKVARASLEGARHDKGGHRVSAIEATERAMAQVQKGIDYDNAHPEEK